MGKRFLRGLDEDGMARVAAEILIVLEDGVRHQDGEDGVPYEAASESRGEWQRGGVDFASVGRHGGEGFASVGRTRNAHPYEWGADDGAAYDGSDFRRGGIQKAGVRRFSGLGDVDDLIEESDDGGVLVEAQRVGASRLPERLSEVFGRDARRYDGAFERY